MSMPLRLLMIERDEDDATLLIQQLRKSGFKPSWKRITTLQALRHALAAKPWDMIVGDYQLPGCTGQETLAAVKEAGLDTPFLIISDTMGEEAAVAAMQAGAADCLSKQNLGRLIPVVERELREATQRQNARELALERNANADRLRLAVEVARIGTFDWDMVADHMRFDDRASGILGLPAGSAVHKFEAAFQLIHPLDRALIEASLAQSIAGADPQTREFRIVRPDGRTRWIASKGIIERDAQGEPARLIGVLQDIHDLKSTEEKLWAQTERLHYLSRQLLSTQEGERRKIARELHDEIGQGLTAAIITLQMMLKQPAAASLAADLREGADLLNTTLQQVRAMSLELRPAMLDDLGLVPALKWHLDRVGQRSGLRVQLSTEGLAERLPTELETVCYRVAQEALTNIVRHSKSSQVQVTLRQANDEVQLTVTDDGRGFDLAAAQARAQVGGSMGLLSMEERVTLLGGQLKVQTAPGLGCQVSARLPLPSASPCGEMMAEETFS